MMGLSLLIVLLGRALRPKVIFPKFLACLEDEPEDLAIIRSSGAPCQPFNPPIRQLFPAVQRSDGGPNDGGDGVVVR